MINNNELLPITTYYIKHRIELDEKHDDIPVEKRFRIRGVNQTGYPKHYDDTWTDNDFTKVLRMMVESIGFREINQFEQDIFAKYELDNHMNDYIEFNYDKELYCSEESFDVKNEMHWTHVYYADFETDVTVSPHHPYLY